MIEQGTTDVGYVALPLVFCLEYGGLCGFVDDMYIEPQARGCGLARDAIAELNRHAESHGLRSLRVETASDNAPAVASYWGAGFLETPSHGGRARGADARGLASGTMDSLVWQQQTTLPSRGTSRLQAFYSRSSP